MKPSNENRLSSWGWACALAAAAASAQDSSVGAAQSEGGLLEEITVTAQRRAEAVQDVPIAVSAFSEEQLERLALTETLDLVRVVPNMLGHNNTGLGTANVYSIRGLLNTESIATFDPPVGTYVDDVFVARQNANNFGLFDVERIEVLRGPQGTLFGRNTTGGAINVILRKPAPEPGGYVEGGFGQFGLVTARGSVDLPITERALSKLSGYLVQDDGWVSNPTTGENDLNAEDNWGVRAALRVLASDTLTWDLAADYIRDDHMNLLNFAFDGPQRSGDLPLTRNAIIAANCRGTIARSRFACTGLSQNRANLAGFLANDKQLIPLGNEVRSVSATSHVEWTLGFGTLSFITGWRDLEQEFALDFFNTAVPTGGFTIANEGEHRQITQEVKLTGNLGESVRYVAGLFYFDDDNTTDYGDILALTGAPIVLEDRILENSTTSWAVYSQWDLQFAQDWTLTVGGRFTREEKEANFISNPNPRISPAFRRINSATIAAAGIPLEQEEELFTPRIALRYEINPDVGVFASATRGFKSGGWNARATIFDGPGAAAPFTPEKVWSYELGLRSEWLERRLRVNVTGFYMDVTDLQVLTAFSNAVGGLVFVTQNFADLENRGVEAEIVLAPTEALTLYSFIGVQDPEYRNLAPNILAQQQSCLADLRAGVSPFVTASRCSKGIIDPAGGVAEPVRAPDTYTLGGSYAFRPTEKLTLTPGVNATRYGDHSVGTNGSPIALVDAYTIVNASLALESDAGWQLSASCQNCTNRQYIASALAELPYPGDPRTWSVVLRYAFGGRE
jgi:iron complex outermembrane receptor protein